MENKRINALLVPLLGVAVVGLGMWAFADVALGKPAWGIFLTNFLFFTGVTQGALVMAVILRITSARWSATFFRMANAVALSFFPVALIMLIFIFIYRASMFYWIAEAEINLWYNSVFFIARNLLLFLGFYAVARGLSRIGGSNAPGRIDFKSRMLRLGFVLLVLFVLYETILSWDMGMILNHGFADSAYAPLFIIGSVYAGAAAIVLLMALAKNVFSSVSFTTVHFSNMGQLLLGVSIFWVYAWYIQFYSIYFVNLPEETGPIYLRIFHGYGAVYAASLILAGALPFAMLILSKIRNSVTGVSLAATSVLMGIWLDRYLIAVPALVEAKKTAEMSFFNPVNPLFTAGMLAIFLVLFLVAVGRAENIVYADETALRSELLISEPMGWQ